jgi:hypothetical protein
MIAVKAIYERGSIKLLEPAPPVEQALAVVVFLDMYQEDTWPVWQKGILENRGWGEPMDEEGAKLLISIHEELAPYRAEAEEAYLNRGEP